MKRKISKNRNKAIEEKEKKHFTLVLFFFHSAVFNAKVITLWGNSWFLHTAKRSKKKKKNLCCLILLLTYRHQCKCTVYTSTHSGGSGVVCCVYLHVESDSTCIFMHKRVFVRARVYVCVCEDDDGYFNDALSVAIYFYFTAFTHVSGL